MLPHETHLLAVDLETADAHHFLCPLVVGIDPIDAVGQAADVDALGRSRGGKRAEVAAQEDALEGGDGIAVDVHREQRAEGLREVQLLSVVGQVEVLGQLRLVGRRDGWLILQRLALVAVAVHSRDGHEGPPTEEARRQSGGYLLVGEAGQEEVGRIFRIHGPVVAHIYIIIRSVALPTDEAAVQTEVRRWGKAGVTLPLHGRDKGRKEVEALLEVVDALVVFDQEL